MTDTNTLSTPKHFIAWVDTHENQNKRLTLHIHLPPGHPSTFKTRIESGGAEVVIRCQWPEEMLDPFILNKGHNMCEEGHNKLVAFGEHIKTLRGDVSDAPVFSECRIPLAIQVEEQLTGPLVPRPICTATIKNVKVLAVELMAVRSNCQTCSVEAEHDSPPKTAAPTPAPSPMQVCSALQQQQAAQLAAQQQAAQLVAQQQAVQQAAQQAAQQQAAQAAAQHHAAQQAAQQQATAQQQAAAAAMLRQQQQMVLHQQQHQQ